LLTDDTKEYFRYFFLSWFTKLGALISWQFSFRKLWSKKETVELGEFKCTFLDKKRLVKDSFKD
jgi:hypothetical protein